MRKISEEEKEAQIAWFQNLVASPQAKAITLDKLERAYGDALTARYVDIIMNIMFLVSLVGLIIYDIQARPDSFLFLGMALIPLGSVFFWDRFVAKPWKLRVDARVDTLEFICEQHGYLEKDDG